ncbi:MAG: tRNA (guanosine(37)-N1)-methyltransferase TrmD [Thermoanaerobaculia bacterium]
MRIDVITIFPELFAGFLATSLVGRAVDGGLLEATVHDLRDFTSDRHRSVDDEPYGGGSGMVMMAPPWVRAVQEVAGDEQVWRVLLSPQGTRLSEAKVCELAGRGRLVLLCGRYEGIDERVTESVVDEEISIGDYVLAGGELPAMVLIEALSRQIPGVVGSEDSVIEDSFRHGLLDHPHYTRPREVEGQLVPEVLLSGDHEAIRVWRERMALRSTLRRRPDLLSKTRLTEAQRRQLEGLIAEEGLPVEETLARLARGQSTTDNSELSH